jgi:hypothetical protein
MSSSGVKDSTVPVLRFSNFHLKAERIVMPAKKAIVEFVKTTTRAVRSLAPTGSFASKSRRSFQSKQKHTDFDSDRSRVTARKTEKYTEHKA